jgi:hypothetical protein
MQEERLLRKIEELLDKRFDARFGAIGKRFDSIDQRFDSIDLRFEFMENRQDVLFTEVYAIKEYMMENMATKAELYGVRDELMIHIDGLYKRTGDLDHESVANRNRSERLETRVTRVETHLGLS